MEGFRVISRSTVKAPTQEGDFASKIELTPWDLRLLRVGGIQKGLLFHNPKNDVASSSSTVQHLKHTFSSTLQFYPPLAGRLSFEEHIDGTSSVFIVCNNVGALFVHAVAHHTTVSQILDPTYIPPIVRSFFALDGVKNYEGTSKPLLAVQVTELVDGVFIGCSMNHSVADGTSFWNFFKSWAEISRGAHKDKVPSNPPSLHRWFPDGLNRPICFHYTKQNENTEGLVPQPPPERVFHFSKEKIAELKAKANAEIKVKARNDTNKTTISSLQALVSHIWRSIVRHQNHDPQEEVSQILAIGARQRMLDPPLAENYFGNAVHVAILTIKAGELLEGGLGNAALEMNKLIGLHTQEKLKSYYEAWVNNPVLGGRRKHTVVISSSPRFDVYVNDFGWGKPVAVRSGVANKFEGKITLYLGAGEGSIDAEVCVAYEILEAMAKDSEFMDAISI